MPVESAQKLALLSQMTPAMGVVTDPLMILPAPAAETLALKKARISREETLVMMDAV